MLQQKCMACWILMIVISLRNVTVEWKKIARVSYKCISCFTSLILSSSFYRLTLSFRSEFKSFFFFVVECNSHFYRLPFRSFSMINISLKYHVIKWTYSFPWELTMRLLVKFRIWLIVEALASSLQKLWHTYTHKQYFARSFWLRNAHPFSEKKKEIPNTLLTQSNLYVWYVSCARTKLKRKMMLCIYVVFFFFNGWNVKTC